MSNPARIEIIGRIFLMLLVFSLLSLVSESSAVQGILAQQEEQHPRICAVTLPDEPSDLYRCFNVTVADYKLIIGSNFPEPNLSIDNEEDWFWPPDDPRRSKPNLENHTGDPCEPDENTKEIDDDLFWFEEDGFSTNYESKQMTLVTSAIGIYAGFVKNGGAAIVYGYYPGHKGTARYAVCIDTGGNEEVREDVRKYVKILHRQPLYTPSNLNVKLVNGNPVLNWNFDNLGDATKVIIHRNDGFTYYLLNDTFRDGKYVDSNVECGKTYSYWVAAGNDFENPGDARDYSEYGPHSHWAGPVPVRTNNCPLPTPPTPKPPTLTPTPSSNCEPTNRPGVYFYEKKNHDPSGSCYYTTSDIANFGTTPIGDNNVSSVKILGQWSVKLYEHPNQQGHSSGDFTSDKLNLDNDSYGGQYSSARVSSSVDPSLITNISSSSGRKYELGTCSLQSKYYTDRGHKIIKFSHPDYEGLLCLKTPNDDKNSNARELISFDLNDDARIYIYADSRIKKFPNWLDDIYDRNNKEIEVSDKDMGHFEIWSCNSQPGRIVLGGPRYEGGDGGDAMYVVAFREINSGDRLCGLSPQPTPTYTPSPSPTPTETPTPTSTPTLTPINTALPDLIVESMGIELETGGACNFTSTQLGLRVGIANIGQADAGPFVITALDSEQTVSGLAAGQRTSVWLAGSHSGGGITAEIDADFQVVESNETNNQLTQFVPVPTLPPTCTPEITTIPPTDTPTPTATVTPTGTPQPGQITLAFDGPASVAGGETFTVIVKARGVIDPGLYGAQLDINYDPTKVSISNLRENSDFIFVPRKNADNVNGKIEFAASRRGAVPGLTGDVTLLTFDVTVAANASGNITFTFANAKAGDPYATPYTIIPQAYDILIENSPTPTFTPSPTTTPTFTTTPTPTSTGEPIITLTPTLTPSPTLDPTITPTPTIESIVATVSGQVPLPGRALMDWSNATITINDSGQSATTDVTGKFSILNVTVGSHTSITADAPGYLPAICNAPAITAPETRLTTINLLSGDINDDGKVDITDATTIGVSFGSTDSNLPSDITKDGIVDIYDIILLSVNFGQGVQVWNCLGG